jgi:adenosylcobinamide-GDP ribazoletransferase
MIREQVNAFAAALTFLTRIPWGSRREQTPERVGRSLPYFPVVGIIVGGIGALVYRAAAFGYTPGVAALLGVAATSVVTGAFHEDALADVCDAFGGWTPERRREIMRDSRVGSFGAVGLILLVGAKILLLAGMPPTRAMCALLAGHAVGRWSSVVMTRWFPYRADESSLARPFGTSATTGAVIVATAIAALATLPLGAATCVVMLALVVVLCILAGRFFRRWAGSVTGDCLGATNQLAEVLCYMVATHATFFASLASRLLRG